MVSFAHAQKLPKIQEVSVRAPADIKIDGKADEWKNKYQAFNIANSTYYTVSNNDEYLYLTVHMIGEFANTKVMSGGLTFSVAPATDAAAKLSVTYPARLRKGGKQDTHEDDLRYAAGSYAKRMKDPAFDKAKIPELISQSNAYVKEVYKDIQVIGRGFDGSALISIYNPEGFRVAGAFNDEMEYTYELAVPLKYIKVAANGKISYTVLLNSEATVTVPGAFYISPPMMKNGPGANPDLVFMTTPTEFSGEYTLAKKK